MKNYSNETYSTYAEYVAEFKTNLEIKLGNFTLVNGEKQGKVIGIRIPDYTADIFLKVEYPERTCELSYGIASAKNIITLDSNIKAILTEAFETLKTSINTLETEKKIAFTKQQEEIKKQQEEEKRIKKEEALKLSIEKRKKNALLKLNKIKKEDISKLFESPKTHYEMIGWLAKHTTNIKASMPDYMEAWFIKNFGTDTERYVVDSNKRTSGGYPMQWSLSCKISFDTEASGILEQKITTNKKAIDSVEFVWDLIDNYGFTFSKTQDLEKIMSEIPTQYIEDFERGYAM